MSVYPTGIDSFVVLSSGVSEIKAEDINTLQESIVSIENTIGTMDNYVFSENKISYINDNFDITSIGVGISPISGSLGRIDLTLSNNPTDIPQFSIQTYGTSAIQYNPVFNMTTDSSGLIYSNFGTRPKEMFFLDPNTLQESTFFQLLNRDYSFVGTYDGFQFYQDNPHADFLYVRYSNGKMVKYYPATQHTDLVAGDGTAGMLGEGILASGTGVRISFGACNMINDSSGNLYFINISGGNSFLRKIDTNGIITTFAGSGSAVAAAPNGDGGPALGANIYIPQGLAIDSHNNIYIASCGPSTNPGSIRKIDIQTGIINTICGTGTSGYSGDGGPAIDAKIAFANNMKNYMSFDENDNLYFSDYTNQRIRKIDASGNISTIAGNGVAGYGHNVEATGSVITNCWMSKYKNGNVYVGTNAGNYLGYISGTNIYHYKTAATPIIPSGFLITRPELSYLNSRLSYVTKKMDALPADLNDLFNESSSYYQGSFTYNVYWSGTNTVSLVYNLAPNTSAFPTGLFIQYHINN